MTITIQDLVQREVIYCLSTLIHSLPQEHKLDEKLTYSLWQGTID